MDAGPSNACTNSERDAEDTNETNDGTRDSSMPDSNETTGNFATFFNRNIRGRMN
jgi:hypothetical protein